MTNAFNANFECLAHSVDMFEFKYLQSSPLGDFLPALSKSSLMSLKVIYFQSIFLIDFYIKRLIYMQESGINFTKFLCSREFKRKQKLQQKGVECGRTVLI